MRFCPKIFEALRLAARMRLQPTNMNYYEPLYVCTASADLPSRRSCLRLKQTPRLHCLGLGIQCIFQRMHCRRFAEFPGPFQRQRSAVCRPGPRCC